MLVLIVMIHFHLHFHQNAINSIESAAQLVSGFKFVHLSVWFLDGDSSAT